MKALLVLVLICATTAPVFAQSATVTWTTTYQTMDGFGGEDWNGAGGPHGGGFVFTPAQSDLFFSPTAGIGLEIIRTANYFCPASGSCAVSTSNIPDLTSLQLAVARGAKIEINMTPPANLQYGGNFIHPNVGTNGTCIDNSNWAAFATFTVQWIQMLNSNSAPVSYLSVSNESNLNQTDSLGECIWTDVALRDYIKNNLGPTMSSAGLLSSVQIIMPENSNQFGSPDLFTSCMNDSGCSQYISIIAQHDYGTGGVDGTNNGYCCMTAFAPPSSTAGKKIWQSEVNGGFTYFADIGLWAWDPSIQDAMVWAHNIHDFLTVQGVSGWEYWELEDCCNNEAGHGPLNDGLVDANFDTSKRMWAIGNWSKYVRSGWLRIGATANPTSGVYVSAFKDPVSAAFAIVAVNQNSTQVGMDFLLSGFPSVTSVTPTLTSATVDLADQTNTNVTGGAFSYSLPGMSVVTFHGVASSGSSKGPAAPTNLAVTVH